MRSPARGWLALLVALSIIPIHGLFTLSRIFFIRDLSFFFWSRHLWLRHTLLAGEAPWWDPHVAAGQSAIADALNQLVMPIALAIRLLPTDIVSFNLWVALPLPIAAVGMFTFLRARVEPPAAALGAAIFTLAGPTVSTLNTPNLSWSVACIPWVLWTVEGTAANRIVWIAIAYALQALSGEPVTWAATGVLAGGWAIVSALSSRRKAAATYYLASTFAGLAAGGCLAAMQACGHTARPSRLLTSGHCIRLRCGKSSHPTYSATTTTPSSPTCRG